ncbi:MAG: DUF3501 family protein [Gammaproteobacteria bacterium]
MHRLSRGDLYTLEVYAEIRNQYRAQVMSHKKNRRVMLGPHATLHFEDRMTIQYQVQEMLRAERIFEPAAIEEELEAYNPLIPDGGNFKATFMLEYEDVEERRVALARLRGVEDRVWVQVGESERTWGLADEDMERENDQKTSAVHFLRFELDAGSSRMAQRGAPISIGIEHEALREVVAPIPESIRASLVADLA